MLINNKKLSVSPITTHIDLKDVSKKLKQNQLLIRPIQLIDGLKRDLIESPKLVF